MYDYGARNYDSALGRWMNINPLAERYNSYSSYNYCVNNPVVYIDPDGQKVIWGEGLSDEQKMEIGYQITQLRRNSSTFNKIFEALHSSENEFSINGAGFSSIGMDAVVLPNSPIEILGSDEKTFELITKEGKPGASLIFYFGTMKEDNLSLNDLIPEEFSHLYQNLFYVGEKSFDYDKKPDGVNIEFEAKLVAGIIKKEANISLLDKRAESTLKPHGYAERLGIKYLNGRGMNNYTSDMRNWINLPTLSDAYKNKKVDYSRLPSMLISLMTK